MYTPNITAIGQEIRKLSSGNHLNPWHTHGLCCTVFHKTPQSTVALTCRHRILNYTTFGTILGLYLW